MDDANARTGPRCSWRCATRTPRGAQRSPGAPVAKEPGSATEPSRPFAAGVGDRAAAAAASGDAAGPRTGALSDVSVPLRSARSSPLAIACVSASVTPPPNGALSNGERAAAAGGPDWSTNRWPRRRPDWSGPVCVPPAKGCPFGGCTSAAPGGTSSGDLTPNVAAHASRSPRACAACNDVIACPVEYNPESPPFVPGVRPLLVTLVPPCPEFPTPLVRIGPEGARANGLSIPSSGLSDPSCSTRLRGTSRGFGEYNPGDDEDEPPTEASVLARRHAADSGVSPPVTMDRRVTDVSPDAARKARPAARVRKYGSSAARTAASSSDEFTTSSSSLVSVSDSSDMESVPIAVSPAVSSVPDVVDDLHLSRRSLALSGVDSIGVPS